MFAVMSWKTAARWVFGVTLIAIGIIALVEGGFGPIWRPVPATAPGRDFLAYLCTIVSLGCGLGLLVRLTAAPAAIVLLVFLLVWAALFKVPFIIRAPLEEGSYQSNGENAVLIAAAWILYVELSKGRNFFSGRLGVRIALLLYGLALIAFGLSHFFYVNLTAPLVPEWLPGPLFWAYFTGCIYLVTGLAVACRLAPRFGAFVAALQITVITILVWGPMLAAGGMEPFRWQETVVSWALTAAAWVIAVSFEGRRWFEPFDAPMLSRGRAAAA
jgi:uncharacterized membrane protein YphA (DoxX/SURF4 family)